MDSPIEGSPTPAARRFIWRFLPPMVAYAFILVAVVMWFASAHPQGPLRYAVALIPAAPILITIWALGRYLIEETDEFQRMIAIQSNLWATGGVLVLTTGWGFLEILAAAPHLPLFMVYPMYAVFCGLAQAMVRLRYR